jgi:hypothetical protein
MDGFDRFLPDQDALLVACIPPAGRQLSQSVAHILHAKAHPATDVKYGNGPSLSQVAQVAFGKPQRRGQVLKRYIFRLYNVHNARISRAWDWSKGV